MFYVILGFIYAGWLRGSPVPVSLCLSLGICPSVCLSVCLSVAFLGVYSSVRVRILPCVALHCLVSQFKDGRGIERKKHQS